jgi:hypothetical protein
MSDDPEIGRQLAVTDLVLNTVVVIAPPGRDLFFTMWVRVIDNQSVTFYSGELRRHVINFIKDGTLFDDKGREVKVFEYLGKV